MTTEAGGYQIPAFYYMSLYQTVTPGNATKATTMTRRITVQRKLGGYFVYTSQPGAAWRSEEKLGESYIPYFP